MKDAIVFGQGNQHGLFFFIYHKMIEALLELIFWYDGKKQEYWLTIESNDGFNNGDHIIILDALQI